MKTRSKSIKKYLTEYEFEVERILDEAHEGRNLIYRVKWRGYPQSESTWESKFNLRNAQDILKEWEKTKALTQIVLGPDAEPADYQRYLKDKNRKQHQRNLTKNSVSQPMAPEVTTCSKKPSKSRRRRQPISIAIPKTVLKREREVVVLEDGEDFVKREGEGVREVASKLHESLSKCSNELEKELKVLKDASEIKVNVKKEATELQKKLVESACSFSDDGILIGPLLIGQKQFHRPTHSQQHAQSLSIQNLSILPQPPPLEQQCSFSELKQATTEHVSEIKHQQSIQGSKFNALLSSNHSNTSQKESKFLGDPTPAQDDPQPILKNEVMESEIVVSSEPQKDFSHTTKDGLGSHNFCEVSASEPKKEDIQIEKSSGQQQGSMEVTMIEKNEPFDLKKETMKTLMRFCKSPLQSLTRLIRVVTVAKEYESIFEGENMDGSRCEVIELDLLKYRPRLLLRFYMQNGGND